MSHAPCERLQSFDWAFKWGCLQATVFSRSGVEVHVSVVPYAQNEGMYHVIHNRRGVFARKLILNNCFDTHFQVRSPNELGH